MRGRRPTFQPLVEPIESRALLSGGLAVASSAHSMVRQDSDALPVLLNGALRGQYRTNSVSPDAGKSYLFNGVSFVRGFGIASGLGEILTPGPGVSGHAEGNLTLLSARGGLTFDLTALEPQTGTQDLATDYSYEITGATGVFYGAQGEGGTATMTLIQGPRNYIGYPHVLHRFILDLRSDSLAN